MHYVCSMYRPYIFNVLASSGLNINTQNKYGNTALHITALQHECCHVTDLFMYGIDPFITNTDGKMAADLAREKKYSYWLTTYDALQPGMLQAVLANDLEKVKYFLNGWLACHLKVPSVGKDVRHIAASMGMQDMFDLIQKHWYTSLAIFSVLESNLERLDIALNHESKECDINFMQKMPGFHAHHVLQHAIRLHNVPMVERLCEAGADVNTIVHVRAFFQGPLYFETLRFDDKFNPTIFYKLLSSGANLNSQDEYGRNILHYCIDKSTGTVSAAFFKMLIRAGADLSIRDKTGCSPRDMARLARRSDLVDVIDAHFISNVRSDDLCELYRLALLGYRDLFPTYLGKDIFIIASGNDTQEAFIFFENVQLYQETADLLHECVISDTETVKIQKIVRDFHNKCFTREMLVLFQDRGGRNLAQKALMCERQDLVKWFQELVPNINTSPPCNKRMTFPVTESLENLSTYEELLKHIKSSSSKATKKFHQVLKSSACKAPSFPLKFHPDGNQLVYNYEDLLMAAILNRKDAIAVELVSLGVDCSIRQQFLLDGLTVWLNAEELAAETGLREVQELIQENGFYGNYWNMGVQKYVELFKDSKPAVLTKTSTWKSRTG